MDPEQVFDNFKLAVAERRYVDAATHATDILDWLDKGGFQPKAIGQQELDWLKAYDHRQAS